MKKVDARMDYSFRTRLEAWNHIKLTDSDFSCLPTKPGTEQTTYDRQGGSGLTCPT